MVTELENCGIQDLFIACMDGLKGFPEAIEAVYPKLNDNSRHSRSNGTTPSRRLGSPGGETGRA
ncbi:MAG: hypothetical protein ACJA2P_001196 [Rhodoferax sp.]